LSAAQEDMLSIPHEKIFRFARGKVEREFFLDAASLFGEDSDNVVR